MFITISSSGYDRQGQQFARGRFLLFMQPSSEWIDGKYIPHTSDPIRCIVRPCHMRPLGNFMMGLIRVKRQTIWVSGSYGSDGLPKSVPADIYNLGIELPADLRELWNKGEGWNGAGSEADAVREWALATFK